MDARDPLIETSLKGKRRLDSLLGRGGVGTV